MLLQYAYSQLCTKYCAVRRFCRRVVWCGLVVEIHHLVWDWWAMHCKHIETSGKLSWWWCSARQWIESVSSSITAIFHNILLCLYNIMMGGYYVVPGKRCCRVPVKMVCIVHLFYLSLRGSLVRLRPTHRICTCPTTSVHSTKTAVFAVFTKSKVLIIWMSFTSSFTREVGNCTRNLTRWKVSLSKRSSQSITELLKKLY